MVREAVVSTWDEIGGRYVLVNAFGDEERMTLDELEVALQQSQVRIPDGSVEFYCRRRRGCSR